MARRSSLLLALLLIATTLSARPVPLSRGNLPLPRPLPPLAARTLHLQRVIDPRFPDLPPAGWEQSKLELVRLMHDLYNLDVALEDRGTMTPAAYFKAAQVDVSPPQGGLRGALLPPEPERAKFVERIRRSIADEDPRTVEGYLRQRTPGVALEAAVELQYEDRARAVLDGLPIEPDALGLVTMAPWSAAMRARDAPEVLVTNLPITYGWRDGTALHALVRGGLIGGFATYAGASRFGGGAMITMNPLLSTSPVVREVGGPLPAPEAAARATGALMAHELSHLMFHVGDNYTHAVCLMHPPPGLDYHRFWYEGARLQPCVECNRDARLHEFARLAGELADAGRDDEAVESYAKAVAAAPDRAELLNEAAWFCAERRVGLATALGWAREAVRLAPRASHILDTLGWIEALTGRAGAAVEHLTLAKAQARRAEPEITYHLGMALLGAGRWSEGAAAAREAFVQGHRPALWKPATALRESLEHLLGQGQRFF